VNITYLRDGKEQKATAELGRWKGLNFNKLSSPKVMDDFKTRPAVPPTEFRAYGFSTTPKLGLSVQDTEDGKGVKVIDVSESSNAAKAGLKEDDIITHINDNPVNTTDEVTKIVKENKDKASMQFKVLRDGKVNNIEVRVPRKIKTADL
jgi:serine protease Do